MTNNDSAKDRIENYKSRLPNHNPININELELRKSVRLTELLKNKHSFIHHLGFVNTLDHKSDVGRHTVFPTVVTASDILTFKEATKHPDEFYVAQGMFKKLKELELNKAWKHASKNSIPSCNKILRGV